MSIQAYRNWQSNKNRETPYLSVVIPTYNEEWRILPTIGAVASFVSSLGFVWEMIVADDGSDDTTTELVKGLELPNLVLLDDSANTGKGGAVRRGVMAAKGEIILFLDADQSTPIEQLPKFLSELENGADIVIGSRNSNESEVMNKSFLRRVLSNGLQGFVRLGFRLPFKDTQCGFKLFSSDVAQSIFSVSRIDGFSFDLELLYIAKQAKFSVVEVPVEWHDAPGSTVSGGREAVKFILDMPKVILNRLRGLYKIDHRSKHVQSERVKDNVVENVASLKDEFRSEMPI